MAIMINKELEKSNCVKIAWFGKHFGEEPPLVGDKHQGAGGIFFTGCNLHCLFCQNYQISQEGMGKWCSIEELVDIMLDLQKQGVINIDLVTPTIWWRQIKQAIILVKQKGLIIPVMWNSNGYESVEMIKELDGLVDIYLPDFKYGLDEVAEKYSGIKNYSTTARLAIKEMLKQVGNLQITDGLVKKGIIVRHLVLPNNIENSLAVLNEISDIDKNIFISLMSQYIPMFKIEKYPELQQKISAEEFEQVCDYLSFLELENGWTQELSSADCWVPNFAVADPFLTSREIK